MLRHTSKQLTEMKTILHQPDAISVYEQQHWTSISYLKHGHSSKTANCD